jgi:hypothetical protein
MVTNYGISDDITEVVWSKLERRYAQNRVLRADGSGKTALDLTAIEALKECRDDVATHCGVLPESLNACYKGSGTGEYMKFDFVWTTNPPDRKFTGPILGNPPELYGIMLAAEFEMGEPTDIELNQQKVLEDFIKLVDIKSAVKVLIYRIPRDTLRGKKNTEKATQRLKEAFQRILRRHRVYDKHEKWLFFGIKRFGKREGWQFGGLNRKVYVVSPDADGFPELRVPSWFE